MQFFLRISILLIFILSGAVYFTRSRQAYQSAWHTHTSCEGRFACWMGITPARTLAQPAVDKLYAWPEPLVIDMAQSGQSVQWQHPQGYQGYMVFTVNRSSIAFIELQFPSTISQTDAIYLVDIILRYGIPAEIARFPDGTTQLYYYDHLLTIRIDTTTTDRLAPHQRVISAQFVSPYGQGISRPRGLIQGYPWQGFTKLPPIPPWGP